MKILIFMLKSDLYVKWCSINIVPFISLTRSVSLHYLISITRSGVKNAQCWANNFEAFLSTIIQHQTNFIMDLLEKNKGVSFLNGWLVIVKFKTLSKTYLKSKLFYIA